MKIDTKLSDEAPKVSVTLAGMTLNIEAPWFTCRLFIIRVVNSDSV